MTIDQTQSDLLQEIEDLRLRLEEAEETLRVIGHGEVDAFLISGPEGEQVFTLKGAEHPYRVLVETMNEGAVILAADGVILYCNNSLATMLQIPLERIVGTLFSSHVAPMDISLLTARMNTGTSECNKDEIILITGKGQPVPTLISCCSFDLSGSQGISMVITDLTQQKRNEEFMAEEKLTRSIIEQAGEVIFVCDEKGAIIRASKLAYQLCVENPLLQQFNELVPLRIAGTEHFFSLFTPQADNFFKNVEVDYQGHDAPTMHFLLNASPLRSAQDATIGFVVTLTDITERKQNEQVRIKLEEQLKHAQKLEAIGTLAGGIAHDFNNILSAILGFAELAREGCRQGSMTAGDLDQVLLAANRAKELVKQILAFSHQSVTEKIPLRPATIVKETLKLLRSTLPTTIDIEQDIDAATGHIIVDPTQVHQVLMNLCTNAYHAMEETGGILSISLHNKTLTGQDLTGHPDVQPGNFMQLSIQDNGVGIPQELQEKIFDPYFTTKEIGKGTGMGLSIVHGIVKSYGGYITCRSRIGEGTVFDIFLPVTDEDEETLKKYVESIPAGTERILLVDDEKLLVEMSQIMLERMGYVVTARTSSIEALTTFRNQPDAFDLVITDQTMPGMTGFDLARRMLQIKPGLPIILCTGYSSQLSEAKVESYGIKGFAMKPLTRKDIAALIHKVLG